MDEKIKILLTKTNVGEESFQYFNAAKITKIKVNSKSMSWNIFIEISKLLPTDVLKELEEKKMNLDDQAKKIEFVFHVLEKDLEIYQDYYKNYLVAKLQNKLQIVELYRECMKIEDNSLILVATNDVEKEKLESVLPEIETFYKKLDYNSKIQVVERHDDTILEKVQKELSTEIDQIEFTKNIHINSRSRSNK